MRKNKALRSSSASVPSLIKVYEDDKDSLSSISINRYRSQEQPSIQLRTKQKACEGYEHRKQKKSTSDQQVNKTN